MSSSTLTLTVLLSRGPLRPRARSERRPDSASSRDDSAATVRLCNPRKRVGAKEQRLEDNNAERGATKVARVIHVSGTIYILFYLTLMIPMLRVFFITLFL